MPGGWFGFVDFKLVEFHGVGMYIGLVSVDDDDDNDDDVDDDDDLFMVISSGLPHHAWSASPSPICPTSSPSGIFL